MLKPQFKTKIIWVLNDLLAYYRDYLNEDNFFESDTNLTGFLGSLGLYGTSYNPLNLSFVSESNLPLAREVLNRVFERYGDHYTIETESEDLVPHKKYLRKVIRVLDFTFPKYSSLAKLYQENINNLLKGIEETEEETHTTTQSESHSGEDSGSSTSRYNDTPQVQEVSGSLEGDNFVSELTKNQSSNSNSGESSLEGEATISRTRSNDRETLMTRLDEVREKYLSLMLTWTNEFDILFIEEVNYD